MATRQVPAPETFVRTTWGATEFTNIQQVLLQVAHSGRQFILRSSADFYILGRAQPITDNVIDFTPYGAEEAGMSRRHASLSIESNHVWITDLNSTNGTFLNGRQLEPGKVYLVRDGDELELGRLKLHIYFTS